MSTTQPSEAHTELAVSVYRAVFRNDNRAAAQLLRDSEARAVEALKAEGDRILDRIAGYITHDRTDGPIERKVADVLNDLTAERERSRVLSEALDQIKARAEIMGWYNSPFYKENADALEAARAALAATEGKQ